MSNTGSGDALGAGSWIERWAIAVMFAVDVVPKVLVVFVVVVLARARICRRRRYRCRPTWLSLSSYQTPSLSSSSHDLVAVVVVCSVIDVVLVVAISFVLLSVNHVVV